MKKVQLNTVHLPMACIGSVHLNTIGYPSRKSSGGITPPEPVEENVWLWGDGDTVLWGDGTNVLTE